MIMVCDLISGNSANWNQAMSNDKFYIGLYEKFENFLICTAFEGTFLGQEKPHSRLECKKIIGKNARKTKINTLEGIYEG